MSFWRARFGNALSIFDAVGVQTCQVKSALSKWPSLRDALWSIVRAWWKVSSKAVDNVVAKWWASG